MFTRIKTVRANGRTYQYLQIVENRWENGRARQRIVGNLGRLDQLQANGDLERIIRGLVAECPQVKLVQAQREQALVAESDRVWGPVLVFERLWSDLGLRDLLRQMGRGRRFDFDVERCAFAIVLQRILSPGSDLQGSKWIRTVEADGFQDLLLPHFYRTVGCLWQWKEKIERHLYERGLDLFNQEIDLVFFDTTSTYFEGVSWDGWAKRGKSRDHRPDHLQLMLGVVMRRDGIPITCEIWPGNTADVTTLVPILNSLKKRFRIRKVVLVCDRGMVSKANLEAVQKAKYDYIVGMKMRRFLEVREQVLRRAGRFREVRFNLFVKEVWVGDRRYVVCRNPEKIAKDREDREKIIAALQAKIKAGTVKGLIPNRGYRRYLKVTGGVMAIDEAQIEEEAKYDGTYVLRTSTDLPAPEVAEAYRQLTWIERLWRELKDVMEVRPIYHHIKKDNVKGHIFASFLALYLTALLRRRLEEQHRIEQPSVPEAERVAEPPRLRIPYEELLRDLSQVRAIRVQLDGQHYLMRTEVQGRANDAFRAAGIRPPPLAQALVD